MAADIFDEVKGDIFDQVKTTPTPSGGKWSKAHKAGKEAVKSQPSYWDQFKSELGSDIVEPLKLAGEAVTAIPSAVNKLASGAGAMAGALYAGQGVKGALEARREAAREATLESPLGPSRTGKYIGGIIGEGVDRLEKSTGETGLIRDVADIVGDVAALTSLKPGVNALRSKAKASSMSTADRGFPLSDKRARYTAAEQYSAAANPLSPRAAKLQTRSAAETGQLQNRITSMKPSADRPQFPSATAQGNRPLASLQKGEANADPFFRATLENTEDTLIDLARKRGRQVAPAVTPDIKAKLAEAAGKKQGALDTATRQLEGESSRVSQAPGPQAVGDTLVDTLTERRKPLREAKKAAYADVDKLGYEMEFPTYSDKVREIVAASAQESEPVASAVTDILGKTLDKARSTGGYDAVYKTLSGYIRELSGGNAPMGATRISSLLQEAKAALVKDAELFSKAAETGDIALVPGGEGVAPKVVRPSKLKAEIAAAEEQLAKEQSAGASLKERNDHLYKELTKNNYGAGIDRNTGISLEQHAVALDKALKYMQSKGKMLDYEPPAASAASPQMVSHLQEGIAQRKQMLENLQPAEDFATAYRKATTLAKLEKERFGTGAVEDVFKRGSQADSSKLPTEKLPAKYTTPTGADDLIRSLSETTERDAKGRLMPDDIGRRAAADIMRDHYARELSGLIDGNPKRVADWISRNKETLIKYRLLNEFDNVKKIKESVALAQADLDAFNKSVVGKALELPDSDVIPAIMRTRNPARSIRQLKEFGAGDKDFNNGVKGLVRDYMQRELETSGVDSLNNPALSFSKAKKLASDKKFNAVLREVYEPKELQKLQDVYATMRNIAKTRNVRGYGSGSDTAANLSGNLQARVAYGIARDSVHVAAGGVVNAGAQIVAALTKAVSKAHIAKIRGYVQEALLDPRKAEVLLNIMKGDQSAHMVAMLKNQVAGYMRQATGRAATGMALAPASEKWKSVGEPDKNEVDLPPDTGVEYSTN